MHEAGVVATAIAFRDGWKDIEPVQSTRYVYEAP
jgi:hypothetical protein